MRTKTLTLAFLYLFIMLPLPTLGGTMGTIILRVNPVVVPADGKSIATVNAEVRDSDGALAPDGTEIRFTATLGVIDESAQTSAGVARAKLIASEIQGTCIITATWIEGRAAAQTSVTFGEEEQVPQNRRYITIDIADYVAYSADHKVLEAIGNVRLQSKIIRMEADAVQINLEENKIVARGALGKPIKISTDKGTTECELFATDLMIEQAVILATSKGGLRAVDLRGDPNQGVPFGDSPEYSPQRFNFADLSSAGILVKAKEATVFPNDKIQFRRASLYVDGKRMFSLPLYVLSLTGYQPDSDQYVGYTNSGLALNVPLYYMLSPNASGALLLRHGQPMGWGWYGRPPGWFIDMRQRYFTDHGEGSLVISQITGSDWGAHFTHTQRFDNQTDASIYLDYPAHRDFWGSLNLNKRLDNLSFGINIDTRRSPGATPFWMGQFAVQTRPKQIGNSPFKFNISSFLRYTEIGDEKNDGFSETLRGNITSSPIKFSRDLDFRTSVGIGYVFGASSLSGMSINAYGSLNWNISRNNRFMLSYRFAERAGYSSQLLDKQSLMASWIVGDMRKWNASIYAIKGLDTNSLTMFGSLSYRLNEDWRIGLRSTLNEFPSFNGTTWVSNTYNDFEVALGKRIGNQEVMAVWSKSQHKILFELGTGAF
ncbi:MAG: invasin domain 3-containing protein [Armatimonadota bacterium]|nr:invasin domain 3-containing protein [Armatimonadota bacterium]